MKRICVLWMAAAILAGQGQTPETRLGAALHQEEAQGDLSGAIAAYKKLLAGRGLSRKVAAEALYHLGLCYQKLGDAEARKAFERLVNEYGETPWAAQARAKLAGLRGGPAGRQTTTVVWSGPTVDPEGTISPDGRYLSHPDWKSGNVAVHDFVTGADRLVTTEGNWKGREIAFAEETAISRDGKRVAYALFQAKTNRFDLRIANLTGDPSPRKLFESAEMRYLQPTDWSPDGKWIAVGLEPENSNARTNQPVQPGQTTAVGLVNAEDGSLRLVRSAEWSGFDSGFGRARISPDGKYLAYDRPANAASIQRDVYVTALDSNREVPAAAGPAHEQLVGWSPDGRYLLFTSNRTGPTGLWVVAFANGAPQGEPELVRPNIGRIVPVGVSAAGALYYCVPTTVERPRIQLAALDLATGKLLSPPSNLTEEAVAGEDSPAWSPDGKSLAYVSRWAFVFGPGGGLYVGDSETSIKLRTIETGEVRELRSGLRGYVNNLRWAPDGRSLLGQGGPNPNALFRFDVQRGAASTVLQLSPGLENPMLSPDGKSVYCIRRTWREKDPKVEVAFLEIDLASGKEREIIRRQNLGGLNLSPDGRYIATASMDPADQARTFLIIPVQGGEPREAIRGGGPGMMVWAPDSRSVFIRKRLSDDDRDVELWQAYVDGSEPRRLDGKLDPRLAGGAVWLHPDGRRIAFLPAAAPCAREKSPAQILVLENFLPTAK